MRKLLLMAAVLGPAGWVWAAPVPRPKAARKVEAPPAWRPGVLGAWRVTWAGCEGVMEFRPDGWYRHTVGGSAFTGRWGWGKGGRLVVREKGGEEQPPAGEGLRWEVSLLPDGDGYRGKYEGDYGTGEVAIRPGGPGA